MIGKSFIPFLFILAYGILFFHQEKLFQETPLELSFPLSAKVQRTTLGYLRQLGGELLFVRANVFLGGIKPERAPNDYAESLSQHLDGAAELHPHFIDTYFLTNSNLPDISPEYARKANAIIEKGMTVMPDNVLWPFFIGFNNFFYINEFTEAATYIKIASEKPDAPRWLGHLASTMAAKGGNIQPGIIWLQGMVATTEDEKERIIYEESLAIFKTAAEIQQALDAFALRSGEAPPDLETLVPEFVAEIPEFKGYELSYTPPHLKLIRLSLETQLRKLHKSPATP